MDYPKIHIDMIGMELSILYFKGLTVKNSIKWCISADLCGISSGSSLFAKVPIDWYPERNKLTEKNLLT